MASIQDHTQLFTRIHIHGITSEHGGRKPITLERYISFPPPVLVKRCESHTPIDINLSPRALEPVFDLTARVRFESPKANGEDIAVDSNPGNSLGYGRAGLVFPLDVLSISPSDDPRAADLMAQLPPLCIKVATPGYARSLAREAWFYEYLDAKGLTGVLTPRCYGVFHAALGTSRSNTDMEIDINNYDYYFAAKQRIDDEFDFYTARMWEEYFDVNTNAFALAPDFVDDRKGNYKSSPWRLFTQSPKVITLTVLVMDLLGEPMTVKGFDEDWDVDIQNMYDDVAEALIVHQDSRFSNLLRVPPHAQKECKTHMCVHRWNFIDWEDACLHGDVVASRMFQRLQSSDLALYSVTAGGSYRPLRKADTSTPKVEPEE